MWCTTFMSATGSMRTMWAAASGSEVEQAMYMSSPSTEASFMRSGTATSSPSAPGSASARQATAARQSAGRRIAAALRAMHGCSIRGSRFRARARRAAAARLRRGSNGF